MKKIAILSLSALLLLSGVTFATEMKSYPARPLHGIWVTIHIIFHKPKLNCENGFGICMKFNFGPDGLTNTQNDIPTCPVRMMLTEQNQLVMEVTESSLSTYENGSTLPYFRSQSGITLDEAVELPADVSRKLGSSVPLVIKPGTYPVVYKDRIYKVVFQL